MKIALSRDEVMKILAEKFGIDVWTCQTIDLISDGGTINHLEPKSDGDSIHWEGNPDDQETIYIGDTKLLKRKKEK